MERILVIPMSIVCTITSPTTLVDLTRDISHMANKPHLLTLSFLTNLTGRLQSSTTGQMT